MSGEIIQQRSSYRQGLVLGLTMAEIMILLVFCLLIAMATFLKSEQDKRVSAEHQLVEQKAQNERDRDVVSALGLSEKIQETFGVNEPKEIDKLWRELVDSRTVVAGLEKGGLSVKEIRDRIADASTLRAKGIDIEKAVRDADIVGAINRAMTRPGEAPVSTQSILNAIQRGSATDGPGGHQWPPIISMSEAGGYFFKSGSAELSPVFRDTLVGKTPAQIVEYMKKYNVDVIEVVGHTDEQPLGIRQSNLDRDLLSALKNTTSIASLIPADNAGLGLARAVSVVSVLRQSPVLSGYKLIPLSGAQLVNTDETLTVGTAGNIQERRRIEIRLRKSVPVEATASVASSPVAPRPKPRPAPKQAPLPLMPQPTTSLFNWQAR